MARPLDNRGRIATAFRVAGRFAATSVGAVVVSLLFMLATLAMLGAVVFGAGCAFTQKVVDRTLLKSPTMKFEDLDRDRDLQDITGLAGGEGGGGGGGGC